MHNNNRKRAEMYNFILAYRHGVTQGLYFTGHQEIVTIPSLQRVAADVLEVSQMIKHKEGSH